MKSEITWSTAIPQPVIAIPVWPVATNADSRPRARAAASSSSVTDILPIAQSEPTVCTTRTSGRCAGPAGTLRPGRRGAQVAQLDAGRGGRRGQLRVLGEHRVQPGLDVHPGRDRLQQRRPPLGGQRAAERRDADDEHVRAELHGFGDACATIGTVAARVRARPRDAIRPAERVVDDRDDLARRRSAGCRGRSWRWTRRTGRR